MAKIIEDNDSIYEELDRLYDEDNFGEIVKKILEIPEDARSVKLKFRLISAYTNLSKWVEAAQALADVFPECKTPAEKARHWYFMGYMLYKTDHEMRAMHCFEQGLEADPSDELGLAEEIENCKAYISEDMKNLWEFSVYASRAIKETYADIKEKKTVEGRDFCLLLGYLSAIRRVPETKNALMFDDFYYKYPKEELDAVRKFLKNFFKITDRESLHEFLHKNPNYNLHPLCGDVISFLEGKPTFDISQLNKGGLENFNDVSNYLKIVYKLFPRGDTAAWDICEKIGVIRHCFACGILGKKEYEEMMSALHKAAGELFDSFEDYSLSLLFGAGLFMFLDDNHSIKSAIAFMKNMIKILLRCDLMEYNFNKE